MIISKTYKENYLKYLVFEIILSFVLIFVGVGFLLFCITIRHDSKAKTNYYELFVENPLYIGLICLVPALVTGLIIISKKSKNYQIVGYEFDENKWYFLIKAIRNSSIKRIIVLKKESTVSKIKPLNFLFFKGQKGYSIENNHQKIYFYPEGFVWEKQIKDKIKLKNEITTYL